MSAARLVHRALAVTPPAALAVALADEDHDDDHETATAAATDDALVDDGDGGGAAAGVPVDRKLGLDEEDAPVAMGVEAARGKGKGKGRKRRRSEMGVADAGSAEEQEVREDDLDDEDGDAREKQGRRDRPRGGASGSKGGRAVESRPSPSLFVAGKPATAATGIGTSADPENGAYDASANVFAPLPGYQRRHCRLSSPSRALTTTAGASPSAVGWGGRRRRGGEPQTELEWAESSEAGVACADADEGWAGMREDSEARELCRRVKGRLVGLFHRGTMCGCSALVEVCLQVRAEP